MHTVYDVFIFMGETGIRNSLSTSLVVNYWTKKILLLDFSGGVVVKNSLASAGDMGLISGPGRFHMPQGNYAGALQLLSFVL